MTYINLISVLIGMVILFPIGVDGFIAAVVAAVVPSALISSVFIYKWAPMNFHFIVIDTFPEALVVSLLGFVLMLVELIVANAIVSILRRNVSLRIANLQFGHDTLGI